MKTVKYIITFCLIFGISAVSFSQDEIKLLILDKNYDEALLQINLQIRQNATADLFYQKGLINNSLQNYQEALLAFSEAFKLQPDNPEIISEMAEGLSVLGNYQDANSYFQKSAKLQPENLSLSAKLGRNYINLKDFNRAYNCFSDIYFKDSTNVYWNKQLAFCAFRTGKKSQAITLYKKVLQQNPRDYLSYFNLIRIFDKEKEAVEILKTIETGLINFPGDADFYNERARFYFETKEYESAKLDYESYFLAKGDSLYPVLMNYGISSYFAKDELKAISILEICASQVANDPYILFYLSLSHKKLNNFEVSEAYMKSAIEAATPAYLPDMYHHLGQIYGQQRKFKESIAALQKSNELDPTNAEVLFEIATTYEEFNTNKTLALNYYHIYLKEVGEKGKNINYALDRITKLKEEMFFNE
jgi:tetratricopeptide (TPR) repeat protein